MAESLGSAVLDLSTDDSKLKSGMSRAAGLAKGGIGKIGGIIVKGAAVATAAIAGIGAAAAGIALKGGLTRLLDIEDAQAKLRGLGHDADSVRQIMDNALASVKGTAFGLGEAATVAASAVAAGVKPGQDLERTLKLVADTATIAGAEMGEMGAIFNKVAASNRLSMEEVNQLAERGVPILSFLAEQMGVTAQEAREMVSRGEVDFETFRKSIEENISGAALESGQTTRGAFKNMLAALSRVGANLLSGVFPIFKEVFLGIIDFLGPIEEKAAEVGAALGSIAEGFKAGGLEGAIEAAKTAFEGLGPGLLESIRGAMTSVLTFVTNNVDRIVQFLIDGREAFFNAAIKVFNALVEALPVIVPQVVQALLSMVTTLVETLAMSAPLLIQGALALLLGLVDGIIASLPAVIDAIIVVITSVLMALLDALPQLVQAGLQLLIALVEGLLAAKPQLLEFIISDLIPGLLDAILEALPLLIDAGVQLIVALLTGIIQDSPKIIGFIVTDLIPSLLNAIIRAVPMLLGAGVKLIGGLLSGLTRGWGSKVVGWFKSLPGKIAGFFSNAGSWLISAGRSILNGLLDGLKSAWDSVAGWVSNIGGWIADLKGPLPEDAVLLEPAGEAIMQGLQAGLRSEMSALEATLAGVTATITSSIRADDVLGGDGASLAGTAGVTVENLNVQAWSDRFDLGQIEDEIAFRGSF